MTKNENDIFILKSPSLYPQLGVQLLTFAPTKNIRAKVKDQIATNPQGVGILITILNRKPAIY